MPDSAASLLAEWDALVSILQPSPPVSEPTTTRVSVTVIGGFLGAGKTTLLRHLLTSDHGLRLAVVVNDLGEVNIDSELLASVAADRIELSNGCSCCTLGPDLSTALVDLATRSPAPDAIVIEASGVGDPTGIATVISAEPRLGLDGIITVVDATSLTDLLSEPRLAPLLERQLDAAHLVVLSRDDLVSDPERARLIELLARVAPGRPVIPVEHGRLDPVVVLSSATRGARPEPGGDTVTERAADFVTSMVDLPTPIRRPDLVVALDHLDVLRAKGFVELDDAPGRVQLVQLVGRSWTVDDWGLRSDDDQVGRLVTIELGDSTSTVKGRV